MSLNKIKLHTYKPESLAAVRRQLRNKLIEVGLQMQTDHSRLNQKKQLGGHSREQQVENLPVLQSFKSSKIIINQFRDIFSLKYQQLFSHRERQKRFSKEVVRGQKYHYSQQTPKNLSPSTLKQALLKKFRYDTEKYKQMRQIPFLKGQLPSLKEQLPSAKGQSNIQVKNKNPMNGIRIIQLIEPLQVKQQKLKDYRKDQPRRSKTQQIQHSCEMIKKSKIKKSIYRQITPWESQQFRDTQINFN